MLSKEEALEYAEEEKMLAAMKGRDRATQVKITEAINNNAFDHSDSWHKQEHNPDLKENPVVKSILDSMPDASRLYTGREEELTRITEELITLYVNKNADYGSAVDITHALFGRTAPLVRIWDKLLRLTQLNNNVHNVTSEKYDETLQDLVNYSLIHLAQERNPMSLEDAVKYLKKEND